MAWLSGSYARAVELYSEALQILLTHTGGKEENRFVAMTYFNIGLAYEKLGKLEGAADAVRGKLISSEVCVMRIQRVGDSLSQLFGVRGSVSGSVTRCVQDWVYDITVVWFPDGERCQFIGTSMGSI